MWLREYTVKLPSSRFRNGVESRRNIFRCDKCHRSYEKRYRKNDCQADRLTFCGRLCSSAAQRSMLTEKRKKNSLDKYGCHYTQLESVKQRMLATRIEKYGTVAPVHHHSETNAKFRLTMLERHGDESPLPKARQTFRDKHGVTSPYVLPEVRQRNDLVSAGQKGYRTMAKKGRKKLSLPEKQLGDWLYDKFGKDCVEPQYQIKRDGKKSWLIDYYVKPLNVYVQLDGVFWHGLDKPLEEIAEFPRIYEQYESDREQDLWFQSNGLRLVRVTDQEWNKCYQTGNFDSILEKLGG